MPFLQLTLPGAFARLQNQRERFAARGARASRRMGWGLIVVLAGCAGIGADSSPEAKQKAVAARAEARWQLLIKGDFAGAYEFLSSGSKATMPLDLYKAKMRPGGWRQATVEKVDCEAEVCNLVVEVTFDRRQMTGIQAPVRETWIIEKGSAWYVYR